MSEGKKYTDEEIVKALKCIEGQYISYIDNDDDKCKLLFVDDILDLIHRFQDENERLKEENYKLEVIVDHNCDPFPKWQEATIEEIAELQKQVDELNERYLEESKERCEFEQKYKKIQHAHNIGLGAQRSHWEKKVEQAVKDTAREILDEVSKHFGGRWLVELYKKYGLDWSVEVE